MHRPAAAVPAAAAVRLQCTPYTTLDPLPACNTTPPYPPGASPLACPGSWFGFRGCGGLTHDIAHVRPASRALARLPRPASPAPPQTPSTHTNTIAAGTFNEKNTRAKLKSKTERVVGRKGVTILDSINNIKVPGQEALQGRRGCKAGGAAGQEGL